MLRSTVRIVFPSHSLRYFSSVAPQAENSVRAAASTSSKKKVVAAPPSRRKNASSRYAHPPERPPRTEPNVIKPREKPRHDSKEVIPPQNVHLAIDLVKEKSWVRFNETVDVAVRLGVDPRKPNQSVKGVAVLPHGTGKVVRIGVFASGGDAQDAIDAGADVVGGQDLIARVQAGEIPFDRVIATPEMMALVSKVGRVLGPRGLMPNPKMGTVTKDVARAIRLARAGSVQFRVDKVGVVHAGIGKVNFSSTELLENLRAFMVAVSDVRPEGFKGKYLVKTTLSSTMGPGVPVELATVDPSSSRFMLHPSQL